MSNHFLSNKHIMTMVAIGLMMGKETIWVYVKSSYLKAMYRPMLATVVAITIHVTILV